MIPVFSSIRHPQSNNVERTNQNVGTFLRILANQQHNSWGKYVALIQDVLNEAHHNTTGFTPIELFLNKKLTRFWENWILCDKPEDLPYESKLQLAFQRIKDKGEKRAKDINSKCNAVTLVENFSS